MYTDEWKSPIWCGKVGYLDFKYSKLKQSIVVQGIMEPLLWGHNFRTRKGGLSRGVASHQGQISKLLCLDLHSRVASLEGLASPWWPVDRGPLYFSMVLLCAESLNLDLVKIQVTGCWYKGLFRLDAPTSLLYTNYNVMHPLWMIRLNIMCSKTSASCFTPSKWHWCVVWIDPKQTHVREALSRPFVSLCLFFWGGGGVQKVFSFLCFEIKSII